MHIVGDQLVPNSVLELRVESVSSMQLGVIKRRVESLCVSGKLFRLSPLVFFIQILFVHPLGCHQITSCTSSSQVEVDGAFGSKEGAGGMTLIDSNIPSPISFIAHC